MGTVENTTIFVGSCGRALGIPLSAVQEVQGHGINVMPDSARALERMFLEWKAVVPTSYTCMSIKDKKHIPKKPRPAMPAMFADVLLTMSYSPHYS